MPLRLLLATPPPPYCHLRLLQPRCPPPSSNTVSMADLQVDGQNGSVDTAPQNGSPTISYRLLKPHLVIPAPRGEEAIQFYKRAFGAEEVNKTLHPKRKADQEQPLILHAHLKFGQAEFLICDESEFTGPKVKSPVALNGTTIILHVETDDVDAAFARAVEAGASVAEEVAEQPWGQRYGKIVDPFGFVWSVATPIKEDVGAAAAAVVEESAQND